MSKDAEICTTLIAIYFSWEREGKKAKARGGNDLCVAACLSWVEVIIPTSVCPLVCILQKRWSGKGEKYFLLPPYGPHHSPSSLWLKFINLIPHWRSHCMHTARFLYWFVMASVNKSNAFVHKAEYFNSKPKNYVFSLTSKSKSKNQKWICPAI